MNYKNFRKKILNELQEFYGQDAEVTILKLVKQNGKTKYGILIQLKGVHINKASVICLKAYYKLYQKNRKLDICIGAIVELMDEIQEEVYDN